ncbi:MAG: DMT family transporter [Puniceicoccaceae bacterium]
MIPAVLTTFLWSYCVIATRRSIEQLGENLANLARILLAVVCLGLMAHLFGLGIGGGGLIYFFLSGVIGFGFGDIGVFYALPRIGSRLTLLMAQCLAAPIAGVAEWAWLGTTLSWPQVLSVTVILLGIVIALAPRDIPKASMPTFLAGLAFGLLAGAGQGLGAVLSRKAYAEANAAGNWTGGEGIVESIWMGATTGYQRLLGGALIIAAFFLLSFIIRSWRSHPRPDHAGDPLSNKTLYVILTAASGPVFGIICFQWALATTPSAIVQPIVAMTPLVVMPMAWYLEGDRPSTLAILGSLVSVAGVVLLAVAS